MVDLVIFDTPKYDEKRTFIRKQCSLSLSSYSEEHLLILLWTI
jgi:hypothetical protein